jgi:hypothetical protein
MLHVIADILNEKLSSLAWIEARTGLTLAATKPQYAPIEGTSQQAKIGELVYPVSCETSFDECWQNGTYKYFVPDQTKGAIAFFVDGGGVTLKGTLGPKDGVLRFSFRLKFLLWMNLQRLGAEGCNLSGRVGPYLASQFYGDQTSPSGLTDVYRSVRVETVQQLEKSPSMFQPFTFANLPIFLYPYDYLGFILTGTFDIPRNCLPEFMGDDFEFSTGVCFPSGGDSWTPTPPSTNTHTVTTPTYEYTIPPGKWLLTIDIYSTTPQDINVGLTSNGTELYDGIDSGEALIGKYGGNDGVTIYFSGLTGTVLLTFLRT